MLGLIEFVAAKMTDSSLVLQVLCRYKSAVLGAAQG
jgi:hypothetical protein